MNNNENYLNYKKIITECFFSKIKENNITEDLLKIILKICYKNCAFSTLPYFTDEMNSEESIKFTNTGNCISLSLYIKNYLSQNFNIESFLIPASIPIMYQKSNFLDLSHVALAVPKNKKQIYILDPAFYFFRPITFNFDIEAEEELIDSVNIYSESISYLKSSNKILNDNKYFNKYQMMPKNTWFSYCYFLDNPNDAWCYYLREIKNPDQAISNFFLNLSKPFITTTKFTTDGYCKMHVYLKIEDGFLSIKIDDNYFYIGPPENIKDDDLQYVANLIPKFYISNLKRYIKNNNKIFNF